MSLICVQMKIDLHMKGWALKLALKKRRSEGERVEEG